MDTKEIERLATLYLDCIFRVAFSSCRNYADAFLCNDYATGVQSVCDDCDALKELLSRDAAGGSLVSFMESRVAGKYNSIYGKEAVENEAIYYGYYGI